MTLRLLALTPKPKGLSPGQRFRLEQWAPHLTERGIAIDFVPFESPRLTELLYQPGQKVSKAGWTLLDFARRAGQLKNRHNYDAVIVYREAALIGPGIYERLFAWSGTPLFFDFDDAIWLPNQISSVNGIFSKLHFWGKTAATCKLSTGVIVGNEYLARYARGHNQNVFVVPTSIELGDYPVQPEYSPDEPFTICWSGSLSTLQHLEHARAAIEGLAKRRKVVVRVICNQAPTRPFEGADNVFVRWTEKGEAETIGKAHAGIMPLPDDEYTRGKCGLKALQFMACGLPVVISPVGMNSELVDSGHNGLLARTDDEWVEALERLATSRDLRRSLGAAGRSTVEQRYSAKIAASLFADAVKSALRSR